MLGIDPGEEIEKKAANKSKPTAKYDSQRETRVLLERIGSDVQQVAEQVVSNTTKLAKLDGIDTIKSELGLVKMAVMENGRDIKELKSGQRENVTKLDKIEQKLDTVTQDHEKRIQKLEAIR